MATLKIVIEGLSLILAIVALLLAGKEYLSHKKTECNKLFSQLNRRFEKNDNMQAVVKYLRDKEPENDRPSLYQFEVFLRFFEELGLYMKTDSLKADEVDRFFGYYLRKLYTSSRGKDLLEQLGEKEENKLELLQIVKEKLNIK